MTMDDTMTSFMVQYVHLYVCWGPPQPLSTTITGSVWVKVRTKLLAEKQATCMSTLNSYIFTSFAKKADQIIKLGTIILLSLMNGGR